MSAVSSSSSSSSSASSGSARISATDKPEVNPSTENDLGELEGSRLVRMGHYDVVTVDLEDGRDYPIYIGTGYTENEGAVTRSLSCRTALLAWIALRQLLPWPSLCAQARTLTWSLCFCLLFSFAGLLYAPPRPRPRPAASADICQSKLLSVTAE
jgi:hypothetical protein